MHLLIDYVHCYFIIHAIHRSSQSEDVAANLTVLAHHHFIHGYFEDHKLLFSLLLALEV